jgi:NADPH:quinone reductase-like Zn-dependent oxidoreductase
LEDVFNYVVEGKLKPILNKEYNFEDAEKVHNILTNSDTIGRIVLIPSKL